MSRGKSRRWRLAVAALQRTSRGEGLHLLVDSCCSLVTGRVPRQRAGGRCSSQLVPRKRGFGMRPLSCLRSLARPLAENWEMRTPGTEMSGNCEERTSWRQQRAMCEVLQFNGTGKYQWARQRLYSSLILNFKSVTYLEIR
jgi:hypothetical protein